MYYNNYPHSILNSFCDFIQFLLIHSRNSNLRESFEMSLKNDFTEYQKLQSQNQLQAAQYQTHLQEPQTPYSFTGTFSSPSLPTSF
jgi:hypothetical protein